MRGLVTSRALSTAIVGVVVLLAAGGGYAVASSSSKKITACVHKRGDGLYTGKCKNHDKKLIWNTTGPAGAIGRTGPAGPAGPAGKTGKTGKTGPQGPGATTLVYNAAGVTTPSASTLGNAGPYNLSALCSQPAANETSVQLLEAGPAATLDGFDILSTGTDRVLNDQYPAHPSAALLVDVDSTTTTPEMSFYNLVAMPTDGSAPVEMQITLAATGDATNTCHLSVVVTPTS